MITIANAKQLINGEKQPNGKAEHLMLQKTDELLQKIDTEKFTLDALRWPIWIGMIILSVEDQLDKEKNERNEKADELIRTDYTATKVVGDSRLSVTDMKKYPTGKTKFTEKEVETYIQKFKQKVKRKTK